MPEAASHTLGSKVWVNDASEGWVKGDVVKVEQGSLKVSTEKGSIRAYKPEECPLQNPHTAGGVEVCQQLCITGSLHCRLQALDVQHALNQL